MSQPLLSGEYIEAPSELTDFEILRAQVEEMKEELYLIKGILLRQYGAFKISFGDQVIVTADSSDKWTAIKARMTPRLREAIDVLLLQGTMKRTQIASALKMDYANCAKNVIGVLKAQGWLVETNGNLSLKVL